MLNIDVLYLVINELNYIFLTFFYLQIIVIISCRNVNKNKHFKNTFFKLIFVHFVTL